jgi:hypothetical protein
MHMAEALQYLLKLDLINRCLGFFRGLWGRIIIFDHLIIVLDNFNTLGFIVHRKNQAKVSINLQNFNIFYAAFFYSPDKGTTLICFLFLYFYENRHVSGGKLFSGLTRLLGRSISSMVTPKSACISK